MMPHTSVRHHFIYKFKSHHSYFLFHPLRFNIDLRKIFSQPLDGGTCHQVNLSARKDKRRRKMNILLTCLNSFIVSLASVSPIAVCTTISLPPFCVKQLVCGTAKHLRQLFQHRYARISVTCLPHRYTVRGHAYLLCQLFLRKSAFHSYFS